MTEKPANSETAVGATTTVPDPKATAAKHEANEIAATFPPSSANTSPKIGGALPPGPLEGFVEPIGGVQQAATKSSDPTPPPELNSGLLTNATLAETLATQVPTRHSISEITEEPPFQNLLPIDDDVLASIREDAERGEFDLSQPVHVWRKGDRYVLVDGHTRLTALREAGQTEVPAFVHHFASEREALDFAIRHQVHRRNIKDGDVYTLVRIYDEKVIPGAAQGRANGRFAPKASSDAHGKTAAKTAEALGTSTTKIEKVRRVMKSATPEMERRILNGKLTINAAVAEIERGKDRSEEPLPDLPTPSNLLAPFVLTDDSDIAFAVWSPIGGGKGKAKFAIIPNALTISIKAADRKKVEKKHGHRRVLVSPDQDLFASDVPAEVISEVLAVAAKADFEFLFWTANPARLREFSWGDNCFAGISIRQQKDVPTAEEEFSVLQARRRWFYIEQLTNLLRFTSLSSIDWIAVKNPQEIDRGRPTPEAVQSLLVAAWNAQCPVFFDREVFFRAVEPPRLLALDSTEVPGEEVAGDE